MNLTQQDVFASIQGMTVALSNSSKSQVSVPSGSANSSGMPAGGPPADGSGAPTDGGVPADIGGAAMASGTSQTQNAQASSNSTVTAEVPAALVEAVIQSLQQKIAS